MTTSTTTLDDLDLAERHAAGIQAHAQISVGLHMSSRLLPPFLSVVYPTTFESSDRVRVHVAPRHLGTWVESLRVTNDDDPDEVEGLLPDTGLRVTVYVTRLELAVTA